MKIRFLIQIILTLGFLLGTVSAGVNFAQGNANDVNQIIKIEYKKHPFNTGFSEIFIEPYVVFSGIVRFAFSQTFSAHDSIAWDLDGDGQMDGGYIEPQIYHSNAELPYFTKTTHTSFELIILDM